LQHPARRSSGSWASARCSPPSPPPSRARVSAVSSSGASAAGGGFSVTPHISSSRGGSPSQLPGRSRRYVQSRAATPARGSSCPPSRSPSRSSPRWCARCWLISSTPSQPPRRSRAGNSWYVMLIQSAWYLFVFIAARARRGIQLRPGRFLPSQQRRRG
jgi:hypothetical protein